MIDSSELGQQNRQGTFIRESRAINPASPTVSRGKEQMSTNSVFDGRTMLSGYGERREEFGPQVASWIQNPDVNFSGILINSFGPETTVGFSDNIVAGFTRYITTEVEKDPKADPDELLRECLRQLKKFNRLNGMGKDVVDVGIALIGKDGIVTSLTTGGQSVAILHEEGDVDVTQLSGENEAISQTKIGTGDKIVLCATDQVEEVIDSESTKENTYKSDRSARSFVIAEIGGSTVSKTSNVEQKTAGPENVLLQPEFIEIFKKCKDEVARGHAVVTSAYLLSLVPDSEYTTVAEVLQQTNFNSKEDFPEGRYGFNGGGFNKTPAVTDLAIALFEKTTGRQFSGNPEDRVAIATEIVKNSYELYFHGTNANASQSIREKGLTLGERDFDANDLEEAQKIFQRIGVGSQWYGVGQRKFYMASDPLIAYAYGLSSPEWFAQFTMTSANEGGGYPLAKRDYKKAKENIEKKIQTWQNRSEQDMQKGFKNLTTEEGIYLRKFFEKYWLQYGTQTNAGLIVTQLHEVNDEQAHLLLGLTLFSNDVKKRKGSLNERLPNSEVEAFIASHADEESIRGALHTTLKNQSSHNSNVPITDREVQKDEIKSFFFSIN